ncbi:putative pectate lyase A [Paramyrothecium foliicola]|nr:putative pectate lyase A [Paramyrothecium foliicola]
MTSPLGFTNNPLKNRSDLIAAARSIVLPVEKYRSTAGARVKIRPATVAAFDDVAAQLEGFSRPLLGIGAFLNQEDGDEELLTSWMRGLAAGVDSSNAEYWGDIGEFDQRMVETESICITLLAASEQLLPRLDGTSQANLVAWLRQINGKNMPVNNWRWFRVFVNLTLQQVFHVEDEELHTQLAKDFESLDSFVLQDGWSSDGRWGDDRRQADYYSGSFAIQFAQLMYVRFAIGNEERKEKYRNQAKRFGAEYWRYFNIDGAAIPFGRSMTYRFAMAAFWTAAALAEVDLPAPVNEPGAVKGLLLRHLRWWASRPDIFNSDGVLNIGFAYPNLFLSEDYNSPQSVYWCLKSLLILLLPATHDFWEQAEAAHPLVKSSQTLPLCKAMTSPCQILNSGPEHHYMLSSGQMSTRAFKSKAAKYCKFAYSSAFGFSVPSGPTLQQMAPDSTISLSIDGGCSWHVRDCPTDGVFSDVLVDGQTAPSLTSTWKPFHQLELTIETTLVPLTTAFPGWHIRAHKVRWTRQAEFAFLGGEVQLVDGGFAIPAFNESGHYVSSHAKEDPAQVESIFQTSTHCIMRSGKGTCGIAHISTTAAGADTTQEVTRVDVHKDAFILRADPNTNLINSRTFIPCLQYKLPSAPTDEIETPHLKTYAMADARDPVGPVLAAANQSECDIPLTDLNAQAAAETEAYPLSPATSISEERNVKAWLSVLGAFLFLFPSYGFMQSIGVIQAYLQLNQLSSYSSRDIGWITGVFTSLAMFLGIQIGPLFDAYGPIVLAPVGCALYIPVFFVLAECREYWHFMLVLGIWGGIGAAVVSMVGVAIVSKWFHRRRGLAMGMALCGSSIGGVVVPLMLRSLFPRIGWAWTIRALAFIHAALMIVAVSCLKQPSSINPRAEATELRRRRRIAINFRALTNGTFTLVTIGLFALEFAIFGVFSLLPLYASAARFSTDVGYALVAIANATSTFGRLLPGLAGDYLGHFNILIGMIIATAIFTGAILVPFGSSSLAALYAFSALWGFGSGWTCVPQNDWYHQCLQGSGPAPTSTSTKATTQAPSSTSTRTSSAPTSTSTGGVGSCNAPYDKLEGYGSGTTGGGSGAGVTVKTCAELEAAVEKGGVIQIATILADCGIIDVNSDTTIVGVKRSGGFIGGGLRIKDVTNVIIRNLKFTTPPEGKDSLSLDGATYVWVDHNEFANLGITGDKDFFDGQLDITHGSDFVTVSWNSFRDHWKGSLVGHSASNGKEDSGRLHVTYHHNWWWNVNSRTPSLRFGTGHIYSSCFEDIPTSGLNIREGAKALVENNHFIVVNQAIVTNVDADVQGFVTERNNIFYQSPTDITQKGHVEPPYSYTLDAASCVCSRIYQYAGVGILGY